MFVIALLVLPANQVVDILHAGVHRFGGGALQFRVERGVDAERVVAKLLVAEPLGKLVMHQVDEVRRFTRIHAGLREDQRLSLGAVRLRRR